MKPIVLASGSPRRRELLEQMGLSDFEVLPSCCDESVPEELGPGERVEFLARRKAAAVAALRPDRVVIGADTVVVLDNVVLGKPSDEADAVRMLTALSGRTHEVYTGIAVQSGGTILSAHECTKVEFALLSQAEIEAYVATGEPMDKAGAYGIQGRACVLIRGIRGDYYNVVGLPVHTLYVLLGQLDDFCSERNLYF